MVGEGRVTKKEKVVLAQHWTISKESGGGRKVLGKQRERRGKKLLFLKSDLLKKTGINLNFATALSISHSYDVTDNKFSHS